MQEESYKNITQNHDTFRYGNHTLKEEGEGQLSALGAADRARAAHQASDRQGAKSDQEELQPPFPPIADQG